MKSMASAQEWIQAPPPGRYNIELKSVEAGFSTAGETHLKISGEISDGPYKGAVFFHNIGTDGGTKYGAMGKKHLRSLGLPVDSDLEIPDQLLVQKLTGLRLQAECGNEQRQKPIVGPDGKKTNELIPQFEVDGRTGQKVAIMNLTILGYVTQPGFKIDLGFGGGASQGQPQGQPQYVAPQGQPQGQPTYAATPPSQYAQQLATGYAPQQGIPAGAPLVPPQFQQPNTGYVATQAQPVWQGQGAPNGVPPGPQMGGPAGLPPGVTAQPQR